MQPPDLAGVLAPQLGEFGFRVVPRGGRLDRLALTGGDGPQGPAGPAQAAQYGLIFGQGVGPAQLVELEQVLDLAQEPVGVGQVPGVFPGDVAALGQRGQRGQGGRAAQGLVGATVHQLQQLDRELDVAQAARAELDLRGA